jgi:hypothetical protein
MPHASHKLELLLVPNVPERPLDMVSIDALFDVWSGRGLIEGDGPGRNADELIKDGFVRIWIDSPDRMWLYANQQGGFRVQCLHCDEHIAGEFNRAFRMWKKGAARCVVCPHCGVQTDLNDCQHRPDAAFACWAIVLSGVQSLGLGQGIREEVEQSLGPIKMVVRRV